jgi:L-lactate dehydrogenase complex protein LldG
VSAAREEILRRVRDAKGAAPAQIAHTYRTTGTRDRPERAALLCERLVDYRARVERQLSSVLAGLAGSRIGVPPGMPAEWRPADAVEDHGLAPRELDALDGVVTGCTVAIAETGTIVLAAGPTEGRRALTLVPDLHVCIVRPDQIVETVPEAFLALRGLERRPLTFVSGPSATSDIELKRVEGVHGPRRLVVVMIEDR